MQDVLIRDVTAKDLNFIFDSFRESMKHESMLARTCRVGIFNREFAKVIDYILARSQILIACYEKEPDVIIGYMIFETNTLHYALVKEAFRGLGVARKLGLKAFGYDPTLQCSLLTSEAKKLLRARPDLKIDHNPFLLYLRGAQETKQEKSA